MRSLDNTTSSFNLFLKLWFYSSDIGLNSRSLLYLFLLLRCCLCCWLYLFILIYKSLYGFFFQEPYLRHMKLLYQLAYFQLFLSDLESNIAIFCYHLTFHSNLHKIFIISGLSSFLLCYNVNTDSVSEENNESLIFDFWSRYTAYALAMNIDISFGRWFLLIFYSILQHILWVTTS